MRWIGKRRAKTGGWVIRDPKLGIAVVVLLLLLVALAKLEFETDATIPILPFFAKTITSVTLPTATLTRGKKWRVSPGEANPALAQLIVSDLANMWRDVELVSNSRKSWERYGVGQNGLRVKWSLSDKPFEMVVGHQVYDGVYARLLDQEQVYRTPLKRPYLFRLPAESFLLSTLTDCDPNAVEQIEDGFTLKKESGTWLLENRKVDQLQVERFLATVCRLPVLRETGRHTFERTVQLELSNGTYNVELSNPPFGEKGAARVGKQLSVVPAWAFELLSICPASLVQEQRFTEAEVEQVVLRNASRSITFNRAAAGFETTSEHRGPFLSALYLARLQPDRHACGRTVPKGAPGTFTGYVAEVKLAEKSLRLEVEQESLLGVYRVDVEGVKMLLEAFTVSRIFEPLAMKK